MAKQSPKKKKNIVGNIICVISVLILAIAVGYYIYNQVNPDNAFIAGYKLQVITSDSMAPELYEGSLILVKNIPAEEVESRDIIMFKYENKYVCHRVRAVTSKGFVTKGDNNRTLDAVYITDDMYIGKVVWNTNIGPEFINVFVNPSVGGIFRFIVFPLAIISFLISISMFHKNRKNKRIHLKNADNNAEKL